MDVCDINNTSREIELINTENGNSISNGNGNGKNNTGIIPVVFPSDYELFVSFMQKKASTKAYVFTDLTDFTKYISEIPLEVLWALAQYEKLVLLTIPTFTGELVKSVGDSFFLVFPTVPLAIGWCLDFQATWKNSLCSETAFGIGYGESYCVQSQVSCDYFGKEICLSSKLGEDISKGSDILLTVSAFASLQTSPEKDSWNFSMVSTPDSISYYTYIPAKDTLS